jgi:hypothetical protein
MRRNINVLVIRNSEAVSSGCWMDLMVDVGSKQLARDVGERERCMSVRVHGSCG